MQSFLMDIIRELGTMLQDEDKPMNVCHHVHFQKKFLKLLLGPIEHVHYSPSLAQFHLVA